MARRKTKSKRRPTKKKATVPSKTDFLKCMDKKLGKRKFGSVTTARKQFGRATKACRMIRG